MLSELIKQIGKDCVEHGYGRKKWWADQLEIPPLTLSHWFAGRQRPKGESALVIKNIFDSQHQNEKSADFKKCLWDIYNQNAIPSPLLATKIILEVLSGKTIDSRTLALLSVFVDKANCNFDRPVLSNIKNRLGWLLEVSGRQPSFKPNKALAPQDILENSDRSLVLKKYLRKFQTPIGRKWKIYDCPLTEMKDSLPWNRN